MMTWLEALVLGLIQGLTEYNNNMGNSMVMKLYWFLLGISLQLINIDKGMVTEK